MFDRIVSALVALSLAFLVWLYVRSRDQEMLDNVLIPVQISLAPGQSEHYELELNGPSQVAVSFSGPPSRIRELRGILQRGELQVETTVTVPEDRLDESRYLDTVRIEASDIHPPHGVLPLVVEGRNRIAITLHHLIERRLPVRFQLAGDTPAAQIITEPPTVLVRGPQEILEHAREIPTQPYAFPPRSESLAPPEASNATGVPLVSELEGRRVRLTPDRVAVHVVWQPPQKVYELAEVPVQFLCPANFPLRPLFRDERAGKMTLRLQGPPGEETPTVLAFVDLSARKWEAGLYEEPIRLQLPKGFQLAQAPPRQVSFQLLPAEPSPKLPGSPAN